MGFSLGPPPCRHPPSLVVSYLGRPVGKSFTTTAGHPGLAGLIHAGDTPSRYIPNNWSEKGKHLSLQVIKLHNFATDLCSTYDESWCFNESRCCRKHKHLPFQCDYNDNETLASYARGYYDFDKLEQIEEFFVFMGAYEISALLKNRDEAPYKSDNFFILGYCLEYYNNNPNITEFLEKTYS